MTEPAKEAWGSSGPYEQYVGRWSRVVAREFAHWLRLPAGLRWGDVGCGTGALTGQILMVCQPGSVVAVDKASGFLSDARRMITDPRVKFAQSDATALPWADASCEAAVSGLVLNFVPNSRAMVAEMARVTRPGGQVAAYVWDYSGGMQMMRLFWDAATQVDPQAAASDQAERFPICQPEPLKRLFQEAGLNSVDVRAIDVPTVFRDFDDYWTPFLGKQGSAPTYLASKDGETRDRIREMLRERLETAPGSSIHLTARAWGVRGVV